LKIVKSPYLSEKLSDFDEIWYTTSYIEPSYSHVTKKMKFLEFQMAVFQMAATAILKFAILVITHRPIGHMIKTASFQNPRWRTAAILKIVKLPYTIENIVGF